jgi:hypothetical protein
MKQGRRIAWPKPSGESEPAIDKGHLRPYVSPPRKQSKTPKGKMPIQ